MSAVYPERKPPWLKIQPPSGPTYLEVKETIKELKLNTVCEEARCPNVAECWGSGTATIMLMGDTCTRACRFCNVKSGNPQGRLDPLEPDRVARAIGKLGLAYVVLTSVDRDDLPDGGAGHFARAVEAIRKHSPGTHIEVLIPDFSANEKALQRLVASKPHVIAQNIETVERLTRTVRDIRSGYDTTMEVLKMVKSMDPDVITKSSIMLGLGETKVEVFSTMDDLRNVGVDVLTLGQYLRPSAWHLPVVEFVRPEVFEEMRQVGFAKGFIFVASGPLVRSSYKASELFLSGLLTSRQPVC